MGASHSEVVAVVAVSTVVIARRACVSDKKFESEIKKDTADAGALGISGTPSFVIGKTDKTEIAGVRIVGAVPFAVFDTAIKDALTSK